MSSKNSSIAALILVVFSTGLASCTLPETSQAQSKCVEQSTSVNCILDTASTGLVNIDDAFAKSSSMAELAVAYSSANNLKKAAELIERARIEANNIEDDKSRVKAISEIAVALSDMKTDKSWVPVLDCHRPQTCKKAPKLSLCKKPRAPWQRKGVLKLRLKPSEK